MNGFVTRGVKNLSDLFKKNDYSKPSGPGKTSSFSPEDFNSGTGSGLPGMVYSLMVRSLKEVSTWFSGFFLNFNLFL